MKGLLAGVFTVLLVGGAGGWYWWQSRPRPPETGGAVFASATLQDVKKSINGIGTLQAAQLLDHSTPLAGTLTAVVKVGQQVKRGQVLAQIQQSSKASDLQDARTLVQEAKQALQSAKLQQQVKTAEQQELIRQKTQAVHKALQDLKRKKEHLEVQNKLYGVGAISRAERDTASTDAEAARQAVQEAQLALQDAKHALARLQSTWQMSLQESQLKLQNAQSKMNRLQQGERFTLRSSMEGTVTDVKGSVGQTVNAGVLVSVQNTDQLVVRVTVDETQIQQVTVGARAEVRLDALKGTVLQGKVTQISPVGRNEQNIPVFDVQVELISPPDTLKPGMSADVDVIVREARGVLTIPAQAVETVNGRHYVQIRQGESVEYAPVELGDQEGDRVVVKSGLKPGDQVQVSGAAEGGTP